MSTLLKLSRQDSLPIFIVRTKTKVNRIPIGIYYCSTRVWVVNLYPFPIGHRYRGIYKDICIAIRKRNGWIGKIEKSIA